MGAFYGVYVGGLVLPDLFIAADPSLAWARLSYALLSILWFSLGTFLRSFNSLQQQHLPTVEEDSKV